MSHGLKYNIMTTTARHHSEYEYCKTLRVAHYFTMKNHVKTIDKILRTTRKI